MGRPHIITGASGSGKSTSYRGFGATEVAINNVEGKSFPFRNQMKYVFQTDDIDTMIAQFKKMPCKVGIIDDAGYLMTHHFMKNHRDKRGNASFDMYDDIADMMYFLVKRIKDELPDDVTIYIIMHEDTDDFGNTKLRTIGKLLDNKVCLEGMVTIVLRCMSENGRHFFRTHTNGNDVVKTPIGMFEEDEIPNDLKLVDDTIREYYGLNTKKEEKK